MLRPGIIGMQGSMVRRLGPCMISSVHPLPPYIPVLPGDLQLAYEVLVYAVPLSIWPARLVRLTLS